MSSRRRKRHGSERIKENLSVRIVRGARKQAAKKARASHRLSLNHQVVGPGASEAVNTSDAHPDTESPNTTTHKQERNT